MTRDRRLLLLLGLLMAYGLFVVECRYHQHEDATTETRHRHRHRHESSNRRNHHELDRRSWQEVDYEYEGDFDDPIDEDDYETRSYHDYPRSHHRSAQKSYHNRMLEPRYPSRYHNDGYHAGSDWYDENNDRRRMPSRYNTKNHRYRPGRTHHRPAYSRNRDVSDFDDTEEDYDYERPYRYGNGGDNYERWRNSRRYTSYRRDWRNRMNGYHGAKRHRLEDREDVIDRGDVTRWTDDWKRKLNSSDSKYNFAKKKDEQKAEEDEDYEDHGGLEEDDRDEDDGDIWKDINERNEDNGEEEFDNDFYKNGTKPLLKTYDDIIKRLTSDDPTTPKTTVKRDYRNTESNKHVKRDGYKNLKYESRNVSKSVELSTNAPNATSTTSNYFVNSTVKSVGHKSSKNTIGRMVKGHDRQETKTDPQAKAKSLEQDYDEYLNSPDNEKEDDLVKTGVEDDSAMQADVTNTDYSDDDNGEEDETDTFTTSTTTTTTTTPKPSLSQHYEYKDPRAYDSGTGAQYNGYQAKNDYPPMSAHSVHKWQSLGTREGVKETRSNMQQYNKNGKSAEIREALQHAIKVNKEGSCQWPRARVIPVRDVYPSPSTTYIPHCAILHRCSDDTGCCRSETLTCVPKHSHRIELSFYTTSVGGASVVEKLSFYNHTECECRERSEYDTTNEKPVDQRVYRHQSSPPPQNMKKSPARKPCRCPSEFTPRITEGVCQCNCFENNENCIKTRRGKGYFSLADRICIQNNECAMPNCDFGEYIKWQGKCPRKKDTFDAMTSYRANLSHRFRS
ncbi:TXVE factor, partial [Pseudoatta argentina]